MSLLGAMDGMVSTSISGTPLILSEDGVAYILAIHKLVDDYDFEADALAEICNAAGGPNEALSMLADGIPAEYILAMGEQA